MDWIPLRWCVEWMDDPSGALCSGCEWVMGVCGVRGRGGCVLLLPSPRCLARGWPGTSFPCDLLESRLLSFGSSMYKCGCVVSWGAIRYE